MSDLLFTLLNLIVMATATLVARYVIPYLKKQLATYDLAWVADWVSVAVKAVEQSEPGLSGSLKKDYVAGFTNVMLSQAKIKLSEEQINNLIEAAVLTIKKQEAA